MNLKIEPDEFGTLRAKYIRGGYPEKWFALYHLIAVSLGKKSQWPPFFGKKEIIKFGERQYGTGEGFYRALNTFDLTRTWTLVRSFCPKDRAGYKSIITEISGQDADVVGYLAKMPN